MIVTTSLGKEPLKSLSNDQVYRPLSLPLAHKKRPEKMLVLWNVFMFGLILLLFVRARMVDLRHDELEREVAETRAYLERMAHKHGDWEHFRAKRASDPDNDVSIVDSSYVGNEDLNTEGLRIYDAFFQHQSNHEIPHDPSLPVQDQRSESIRPHHRTSAAWTDENGSSSSSSKSSTSSIQSSSRSSSSSSQSSSSAPVAIRVADPTSNEINSGSVFRGSYTRGSSSGSSSGSSRGSSSSRASSSTSKASTINLPNRGRAMFTPDEDASSSSFSSKVVSRQSQSQSTRTLPASSYEYEMKASRNRAAVRSGGSFAARANARAMAQKQMKAGGMRKNRKSSRMNSSGSGSLSSQFSGLKSVHYVAMETSQPNAIEKVEGVYKSWTPARWVARMGLAQDFPMSAEGKITIQEAGVYFVYAQVSYQDEHDVSAFQVFANEDAFLFCTVMRHTPHITTKTSTCYSAGLRFLESGDQIYMKDMEPHRNSIMLPGHTFFGLIQISGLNRS